MISKINSREINRLCDILRQSGPVTRRMIGNNIWIYLKSKSASVPVAVYVVNPLDHVHRVVGHMRIGPMVGHLSELIVPHMVREIETRPRTLVMGSEPTPSKPRLPKLLRPRQALTEQQREMRERFLKQVTL